MTDQCKLSIVGLLLVQETKGIGYEAIEMIVYVNDCVLFGFMAD